MATSFIQETYQLFEKATVGLYASASAGISGYVIPIAWIVLAISLLVWCYMTMSGKTSAPVLDWFIPFIAFMLVLYAMGSGYTKWIADPLWNLPEELLRATNSANGTTPIDALGSFVTRFMGILSGAFAAMIKFAGDWDFGSALTLLVIIFVLLVFAVIATVIIFCGLVYAKLGLSLVLAVGPLFVFMLVIGHLRDKFFSWLSTALFFVLYYLLCYLFMSLIFNFIDSYIGVIGNFKGFLPTDAGAVAQAVYMNLVGNKDAAVNIVLLFIPLIVILFIMAFLFLQLSTIASSMTAGSGGAVGQGASSLIYYMRGFTRSGGSRSKAST